jgi:hypothetical protein
MPDPVRAQGSTRDAIREFWNTERRNGERIQKFNLHLSEDDELPPYVPEEHPYPKALYAPDGETIIVAGAQEERERLAEGYYGSLAECLAATDVALPDEADEYADAVQPPKRSHSKKKTA